jgi:hypothetical protein
VQDSLGKEFAQTALLEISETGQQIRVPLTGSVCVVADYIIACAVI